MLKHPSPIEQDLDEIRDAIWQEAGMNIKKLHRMISDEPDKILKKYGYTIKPVAFNIGRIIRDKSKISYKSKK